MYRLIPFTFVSLLLLTAEPVRSETCWSVPVRDRDHLFGQGVYSWTALRDQNIVKQKYDYSCGAATLATIGRYYWEDDVTEETFLRALDQILKPDELKDRVENGLAISDLRRAAVKEGYLATIGKLEWDKLQKTKVPVILPIKTGGHDHFVVYRGTDCRRVYLADPIRGNTRVLVGRFLCEWQKNAVLVVAKKGQKPRSCAPLSIKEDELFLGETNRQRVRTQYRDLRTVHRVSP